VLAVAAHRLSEISAIPNDTSDNGSICSGTRPAARITNCGGNAQKMGVLSAGSSISLLRPGCS
jgi:hypothetical protein